MRVPVGKATRVGPGDEIVVRGQLPSGSRLGRLYVFSSEGKGPFSPYVQNLAAISLGKDGGPSMLSPMSMRLIEQRPSHELSFVSDIDGYIRVMQEVDTAKDPLAKVRVRRRINPELPLMQRISRHLAGLFT